MLPLIVSTRVGHGPKCQQVKFSVHHSRITDICFKYQANLRHISDVRTHARTGMEKDESEDSVEGLSDTYTEVMQERMGAPLVYSHEDGMNYTRILDDLIVGSCLQTEEDVEVLEQEGVRTIMCLQEDSDMEYFSLDVEPIRQRCVRGGMIEHLRHAIRDFDPYSLRRRLPGAVSLIAQSDLKKGDTSGTTYIHCTAGLGRAPATALGYMWWMKGIPLDEAYAHLTGLRPCKPREEAIREAAVDMLYGKDPVPVIISLRRRDMGSSDVRIAGIDVGWGQSVQMLPKYTGQRAIHMVKRHLPPGKYQFKFIWDDVWGISMDHMTMIDGSNVNNLLIVPDAELSREETEARQRIRSGGDLTADERSKIQGILLNLTADGASTSAPADLNPLCDQS